MLTFQPCRAVQAAAESLAAVGPEARCESKEFIADSTLEEHQISNICRLFSNFQIASVLFPVVCFTQDLLTVPPSLDVADHTTPVKDAIEIL